MTELEVKSFKSKGFIKLESFMEQDEIGYFRALYEDFLSGIINTSGHRSDLSGSNSKNELIVQIMRPALLYPPLKNTSLYSRVLEYAKTLLGDDMELDFDMLIDKPPNSNKETPFHQDEAYWIDMKDKRTVSCWIALDDVYKENGCMWFVPESHKQPLRKHIQTGNGGALMCEASEDEALAVEMLAGSCTFHDGRTIHYARGNSTDHQRRAIILNFRPSEMIQYERDQGFDHLGERKGRS